MTTPHLSTHGETLYLGGVQDMNRIYGTWCPAKRQWCTWLVTLISSDKLFVEWDEEREKAHEKTVRAFSRNRWLLDSMSIRI